VENHLSGEEIAPKMASNEAGKQDQLPAKILAHVEKCLKCKVEVVEVVELISAYSEYL